MRFINILQIMVSILLVVSILMQNRGSGLSSAFGGTMGGYYTKRGFEKFLMYFSIILSVLFIVLAIASVLIS
ncbi:MAG: preprotein translocase subunit SecG [Candidatus Moranbacteria bacterium]|jgi:protein translocase SecG subunit|nr:preprotein translocase subunit SecG [Candidatus Moranbacteria bacterium]MDD5652300.1 preprotein translocase subunit SecG [Candidatus Moranbacteria bacterium]MDX9855833.1 preprotein translocase subunit SecG [Candidatus Moranbacteria bacterium]